MNERTITFRLGEENGIVIQKDSFETSLFLNQYQHAINLFDSLWSKQEKQKDIYSSCVSHNLDNQFSNIIAFCGDRGEGKTSCMSSFATILADETVRNNACKKKGNNKILNFPSNFLKPQEIEWLDTIDPSFFDTKHNLLELLLGRMYANVSNVSQNRNGDKLYYRRLLMEQFEKVKTDISQIEKNDKIYDSLEEISDLAAGVNLKKDLQELFTRYLEYVGKKCLLICIDDLDLNIFEGYKMAEMLRKYLICPQCMILVAVKVGQLIEVIATTHKKEMKEADIPWERCMYMAQKYVAKLLPRGNRIVMPVPTDFCDYVLEIRDYDGALIDEHSKFTVKEKVVQMIFQKTGYVFYNTQYLSPIIPKNLRSLRHLLGMLFAVPDAKDADGVDNEIGRDSFKNYFFSSWAAQLPNKDYTFAQQLAQYDDLTTLNAFVVEYFSKRVKDDAKIEISETDMNEEYAKLYLSITNKKNTATNISYGDVMYMLWFINSISLHMTIQNLIFLIKTVYSMRLYACYNIISQGQDYLYPPTPNVDTVVHIHKAETVYEHVNQLQKLVNGSFFTYPQGALLPTRGNNMVFRDRVIVHIEKIKALIDRTLSTKDVALENLKLCEYLALCISRTTNSKETTVDFGQNRSEKIPTYLGVLSAKADYLVFDFLQPFYSLCNIEYAYHRFDALFALSKNNVEELSLLDLARNTEGSIYNSLLPNKKERNSWEQMHRLISDSVIRVSEVQWAIFDELVRKRNLHKDGNEAMYSAYRDIQNLQIKLYPLMTENPEESSPWILKFAFLSHLSSINYDALGDIIFMSEDEKRQREVNVFIDNVVSTILNIYVWPIKGKDVRQIITGTSQLKDRKKASFTRRLKNIFEDEMLYSKEQLLDEKFNDILKEYILVTAN